VSQILLWELPRSGIFERPMGVEIKLSNMLSTNVCLELVPGGQVPVLVGRGERLPNHAGLAALASKVLVVNPAVGFLQSNAQRGVGLPLK
jgi:hypothetical protein